MGTEGLHSREGSRPGRAGPPRTLFVKLDHHLLCIMPSKHLCPVMFYGPLNFLNAAPPRATLFNEPLMATSVNEKVPSHWPRVRGPGQSHTCPGIHTPDLCSVVPPRGSRSKHCLVLPEGGSHATGGVSPTCGHTVFFTPQRKDCAGTLPLAKPSGQKLVAWAWFMESPS